MRANGDGRLREFREKPTGAALEAVRWPFLDSMGIDVFERKLLFDLLGRHPQATDFGKEISPAALAGGHNLQSHIFQGCWEDIGMVKSIYEVNLTLAEEEPPSPSLMRQRRSTPVCASCPPASCGSRTIAVRCLAKPAGWIVARWSTPCWDCGC